MGWRHGSLSRNACLVLLLLGIWTIAGAQDYGAQSAHIRLNRVHTVVDIAADHTSVSTVMLEREALSADGAVAIGTYAVSFNPDLESLDILEAYTEKADGARIAVGPDGRQRQTGLLAAGTGISWPGLVTLQVVFPQVLKGDKTLVSYRRTVRQAPLPKALSGFDFLPNNVDVLDMRVTLSAPESMPVQVAAERLDLKTSQAGGRKTWHIQGSGRGFSDEPQLANGFKVLPYWMYSTLPSRWAFSDVFAQSMRDRRVLSPELKALAQQVVQGASTPHEKARAIHRWVAQNMRYVAVFVGTGGYVPNDLNSILSNRYGDCKDLALLTMSLLLAVGIESAPALINTFQTDWVPPVAAVGLYNHVIVYIPSLNLFTDPTAQTIPFGKLPWADAAKPVLVGLREGSVDMRTPVFEPEDNLLAVRSHWVFDPQGGAKLEINVTSSGEAATEIQNQLEQIPAGAGFVAVQRFLKAAGLRGTGRLKFSQVNRQVQAQSFALELNVQAFLNNPEMGSVQPHPMITSLPVYLSNHIGPEWLPGRRFDALCTPVRVEESFTVVFPQGVQVLAMPKAMALQQAGIYYLSDYSQTASGWTGKRVFQRLPTGSGHICTGPEMDARRPLLNTIRKELRDAALFKAQ
jgi:hypothetical protein